MVRLILSAALLLILAVPAQGLAAPPVEQVKTAVGKLAPGLEVSEVAATPVDGLFSAVVDGQVIYVTGDGQFVLQGDLIDVEARRSLTEDIRREIRRKRLAAVSDEQTLNYDPEGEAAHEVTVITDIDCPYCRKLHRHMPELLDAGVRVRYLLMPRAGKDSRSYDKAVSAWCADDPQSALTRAKRGEELPQRQCDHPVDGHMRLAEELGVRGTPAILFANGRLVSGYRPPDQLVSLLESEAQR